MDRRLRCSVLVALAWLGQALWGCAAFSPGVYAGGSGGTSIVACFDDERDTLEITVTESDRVLGADGYRGYNPRAWHAHVTGVFSGPRSVERTDLYSPVGLRSRPTLVGMNAVGAAAPPPTREIDHSDGGRYQGPAGGPGSGPEGNLYEDGVGRLYVLQSIDAAGTAVLGNWNGSLGTPHQAARSAAVLRRDQQVVARSANRRWCVVRAETGPTVVLRDGLVVDNKWLTDVDADLAPRAERNGWLTFLSADGRVLVASGRDSALVYVQPSLTPLVVEAQGSHLYGDVASAPDRGDGAIRSKWPSIFWLGRESAPLATFDDALLARPAGTYRKVLSERFGHDGATVVMTAAEGTNGGPVDRLLVVRWDWRNRAVSVAQVAFNEVQQRRPVGP